MELLVAMRSSFSEAVQVEQLFQKLVMNSSMLSKMVVYHQVGVEV